MTPPREFALCVLAGLTLWVASLAWHGGARYPGGALEYPYQAVAAFKQGCAQGEWQAETGLQARLEGDRWIVTNGPEFHVWRPTGIHISGIIDARMGRMIDCRYGSYDSGGM